MTRAWAIAAVINNWDRVIGEFCIGDEETAQFKQECLDVLHALGVTDAEIAEAPV